MKIIAIILALAATMVAAIPASVGANLEAREPDCQTCFDKYDSCINNGHTAGQTGCMQTCAEHVCWLMPECRDCGDELGKCPKKSRYFHGQGPLHS